MDTNEWRVEMKGMRDRWWGWEAFEVEFAFQWTTHYDNAINIPEITKFDSGYWWEGESRKQAYEFITIIAEENRTFTTRNIIRLEKKDFKGYDKKGWNTTIKLLGSS